MLNDKQAVATIAVRDVAAARQFYEGKLGLAAPVHEMMGTALYDCGNGTSLLLYQSDQNAGTNKATSVTWFVGDKIADTVSALKDKGVTFETYDMPDSQKDGDIYIFGEISTAWFTDPDGNIHAIVNG